MNCLLLVTIALLVGVYSTDASRVYHIIPSQAAQCPAGESCVTLSTRAANANDYIDSNTTMIFLGGRHTLNSNFSVSTNAFLRLSTSDSDTVTITCRVGTDMLFNNFNYIQVTSLDFFGCRFLVQSIGHFVLEDSTFHGRSGLRSALQMTQTNSSIVRSTFTSNTEGTVRFLYTGSSIRARVGGALIVTSSNLDIFEIHFYGNNAQLGRAIFLESYSNVSVTVSAFSNNTCTGGRCQGGAIFVYTRCNLAVHNSTFA